jgi:hypothetical protein
MPAACTARPLPAKQDKDTCLSSCREALVVCEAEFFDTFLAIAIDDDDKRALNREVWVATAAMNKELRAPHKNPGDREERLAKSIRVEDLGVAFVDTYTAAIEGDLTRDDPGAPHRHQRALTAVC